MQAPVISVIVPCYNQEDYLAECLDSVLAQTFPDFEIIIVDDGSSDGTGHICQEYADKHARIRSVRQRNQGVVAARNNAIAQAQGEFIYPLDGDDKIDPTCLEKLYAVMRQDIFDVVYAQTEYFGARTGLFDVALPDLRNMWNKNQVVCSGLYRKADWEKYGGYDPHMKDGYEDWEFWLNFIADGKLFYRVNERLFFYRIKDGSRNHTISKNTAKILKAYIYRKHTTIGISLKKPFMPLRYKVKQVLSWIFMSRKKAQKIQERYQRVIYPKTIKPKLIMTLLVKDEADIIEQNLIFHRSQGIDGFIVTDNVSQDGTRDILQRYQDKGWILDIIDEPSQDYSQAEWVHRMIILAQKKYHADWVINADADEFWCAATGSLKDELAQATTNKIFVPIYNMLSEHDADFLENDKKIVKTLPQDVLDRLQETGKLSRFSQFSVSIPKVIHRTEDYGMIHMGNHNVDMVYHGAYVVSGTIQIYHYNLRGPEHFRRKIITGGQAYERNHKLDKSVGIHWRYFYEGFRNGTLDLNREYEKATGMLCRDETGSYKVMQHDDTIRKFFAKG